MIVASLSDPESRQIIRAVIAKPKTVAEIEKELSIPRSTLYRKLSEMKECGILMVEEFAIRQDGRREALYACPFTELRLKPGLKEVELELIETKESVERKWFELFFSKRGYASESESSSAVS